MIIRTAVLAIYLAALAVALVLQFLIPGIAMYVFYGFLFWLVASFFVFRMPSMNRPFPRSAPPRPSEPPTAPHPHPLTSAPLPSGSPVALAFCAFCGADLPAGASTCPVCQHAVRSF